MRQVTACELRESRATALEQTEKAKAHEVQRCWETEQEHSTAMVLPSTMSKTLHTLTRR